MVTRSDPEKHKAQVRAANRARYKAVQLLINAHQSEFDALYSQQASLEGVEPKPRGRVDAEHIQSQIAELQARLKQVQSSA
jgi:uncharacterized protein involved in exopolysaccharide biosynthesis